MTPEEQIAELRHARDDLLDRIIMLEGEKTMYINQTARLAKAQKQLKEAVELLNMTNAPSFDDSIAQRPEWHKRRDAFLEQQKEKM